jgi:hypothetical protein
MDVSDLISTSVQFTKLVQVLDQVEVDKSFEIAAFVVNNSAMADATADALGYNTHTETLTTANTVEHVGSASASQSIAASDGFHYSIT